MKSLFKTLLILSLLLTVLALAGGFAIWQEIASHPEVQVSINGEDLALHELHGLHWGGLLFGGLVTGFVLLIVLPLALLLGLGLPLLIVGGMLGVGLLALIGVGGLLLSPLLLVGLVLWLLLRDRRNAARPSEKPQVAPAAQP